VNTIPIDKCTFEFVCPRTWDALACTNIETIRFCAACERHVYLSRSKEEASENARQGRCVAVPVELADPQAERPDGLVFGLVKNS